MHLSVFGQSLVAKIFKFEIFKAVIEGAGSIAKKLHAVENCNYTQKYKLHYHRIKLIRIDICNTYNRW